MTSLLSRNRRRLGIGAVVGTLLGVGGVALAAILLTTTVTGTVGYSGTVVASQLGNVSVTGDGGVSCSRDNRTKTDTSIAVNAEVQRLVGGGTAESVPGTCLISLVINNTGAEPLTVVGPGIVEAAPLPAGWTITGQSANRTTIPVDRQARFMATLTAGPDAEAGALSLKVDLSAG